MHTDDTFSHAPAPFAPESEGNSGGAPPVPVVMIVEDDPFIAMDMEDSFLEAGFEVMGPFAHAETAIAACRSCVPDVATLDYRLGMGTSRRIAEELDSQSVPVVMVTGSTKEMRQKQVFRDREVFGKPCDMSELIQRARQLATA